MSASMRNLSLGNGSQKTYNLRHLPWAVRPPASPPTLFLAYTLDFSKGAFANLFIQGCFSNICQSIYINIDVKRDNLCISICMSNRRICIYIYIYISVWTVCPGGRKGGCFGIPPECRECNQVPFLLSLSPTPPSFWCASIVFLSHYSLWFLLIFTRTLVTISQNYIFWYFVLSDIMIYFDYQSGPVLQPKGH